MKAVEIVIHIISSAACIFLIFTKLIFSEGKEKKLTQHEQIAMAIRTWEMAEYWRGIYKIPCFTNALTDDQLKYIIWQKIQEFPQYDSVYVTLCPRRDRNQYAITNRPTFILIRFWTKRRAETQIPHILYDPYADSLHYLGCLSF